MPALPARTRSVTRLSACDPAATNGCWPAGMTRFRNWSSLGLIRFRRRRQKNAVRSIEIARAWFWANAHGTATLFNDAAEGKAIGDLFGRVPISSTKSMMGHSLGAAGAIEAIICLLALQHQFLPPNINFRAPDQLADLNIVANEARRTAVRTVLSNSFGFGGTNASILMQKFEA